MKVVEDDMDFLLSDTDIPRRLDMDVLDIDCPRCRFPLRLPEASATKRTAEQVDMMQKRWNEIMLDVVDACRREYGEDVRLVRFVRELEAMKRKFLRPGMKVVPRREE